MGFDYAGKVRSLLAKADSAEAMGNDAEAAAFRAGAFRIMKDYQIAEEEALAVDPTFAVPTHLVIDVPLRDWSIDSTLQTVLLRIARHTGVRVNMEHINAGFRATIVGYDGDVRYTEFLWTSAHLMFSTKISPTWDGSRTEADNIFFLRNAGIERRVIADKAWGYRAGHEAKNRSKVQRIYVAEAARRGEPVRAAGLGFNTDTYRQAYAQAFVDHLTRLMRESRDAANSVGGGLVLAGREERVDEAFYVLFPYLRPQPSTEVTVAYVDPRTTCEKASCKNGGYCRDHAYLRPRTWTQRDEINARRRESSPSARAGQASGRDAAAGVVIARGHTTASRLDPSGRAIEG